MSSLRLDWCSHQAAAHAVRRWHYSASLPTPPLVKIGVWEDGTFAGAVVFSRGASPNLLKPFGLDATEGAELTRVALGPHRVTVSRVVAIALRMLRRLCPGLRLVVSYADPAHGHHGGIYQAGGWIYTGTSQPSPQYRDVDGRLWHSRMVSPTGVRPVYGQRRAVLRPSQLTRVLMPGKHRYLYALDDAMRQRVTPLAKPYPRRRRLESEALATPGEHEGAAMRPGGSTDNEAA